MAKKLGLVSPVILQSMFIFKVASHDVARCDGTFGSLCDLSFCFSLLQQPGIGGEGEGKKTPTRMEGFRSL